MIRSSLCDYSDAYVHVQRTIPILNRAVAGAATNNANKKVIIKNCAPFMKCISEKNNTELDDTHDIDIVMPIPYPSFIVLVHLWWDLQI